MKEKILEFFKALGAFLVVLLCLAALVVSVIDMLFPTVFPDWVYTALFIVCLPFGIAFFVTIFKEWRKQRKAKKKKHEQL